LSFVPKLIIVGIALALFGSAIMMLLADFTREMFARIPDMLR
jgi:flagellar biosynthetic protein FliQ